MSDEVAKEAVFDESKKGLSIASLILGIVALIGTCIIPIIGGVIPGILAIIFGAVALHKKEGIKGLSIAGIILGALGVVLLAILLPLGVLAFAFPMV